MIKYDVYKNKRSGIYYCVNLMGGINERHMLLPDEPPYTLERSTWRAGDVLTRHGCIPAHSPKRSIQEG